MPVQPWYNRVSLPAAGWKMDSLWNPDALVHRPIYVPLVYTIFGASERKLQGYNDCFRDCIRIFPMSDKRLIPDLYHIVLHILILINIVLCLI